MTSSYFNIIDDILTNMEEQGSNISTTSMLLAGDPGVGKTSLVKLFSKLTGLSLIVIEAPHIVEEHIINVPFILYQPVSDTSKKGHTSAKLKADSKFNIVLSDSYLATTINKQTPIPDEIYLQHIQRQPQSIQKIYEKFGGTEDTIPEEIQLARKKFKTILFLDEYFRKTSPRIRNILRTILNGNIGIDPIPDGTYVMYASNLNDEGLDNIPLNVQVMITDVVAPSYEEWVNHLTDKYGIEDDTISALKKVRK